MPHVSAALVAAFLLSALTASGLAIAPSLAAPPGLASPRNTPGPPTSMRSPVEAHRLPASSTATAVSSTGATMPNLRLAAALSSMGAAPPKDRVGATIPAPRASALLDATSRTSPNPTPATPYEAGSVVIVWQWCDTAAAMGEVADVHAARGLDAARARWDALVEAGACHWIPPALATTAVLVNHIQSVDVTITLSGRERSARVEIWLAAIDGVKPHGYVATLFPLPGEET